MKKEMTLNELRETAKRWYEKDKAKKRQLYHLAKELGFTTREAIVLQHKTETLIRKLASEKGM